MTLLSWFWIVKKSPHRRLAEEARKVKMKIAFFIPALNAQSQLHAAAFDSKDDEGAIKAYLQRQYCASNIMIEQVHCTEPLSRGEVGVVASDAFKLGRQYERQLQEKAMLEAIDLAKTREEEAREIEEARLHTLGVEGYWD